MDFYKTLNQASSIVHEARIEQIMQSERDNAKAADTMALIRIYFHGPINMQEFTDDLNCLLAKYQANDFYSFSQDSKTSQTITKGIQQIFKRKNLKELQ